MNPIKNILNRLRAQNSINLVGAPSFAEVNPYGLYNTYCSDEYSSQFPNIRPIVNELMSIPAYAVDSNGKSVPHPALDALYHPNKADSYVAFMEKLAVSVLSLDYTYLLVWRREGGETKPGGDFGFKGINIGGFTFLENPAVEYRDGKIYYKMGAQEFTEDEVIAIPGGAKPGNLYGGYSPAQASAKWASIDGYIGDYQKGFFKNGAIPSGMFIVTAATNDDFKAVKKKMEEKHRGAGKNNNVMYSHAPLDRDGKPQQEQIKWIPFQQSNKDIDFKNLLDHVDNRLSESYGVSSIIKGVDSAAKYSNAEVSEANFAKRAVNPLALRIFSQITHELSRMTGGLGIALRYKYEIPAVADAEKVKAETKKVEVDAIMQLINAGFTLDSAVDALKISQSYKLLAIGNNANTVIDNDKPEVDEGGEVEDAPDPAKIDGITPVNKGEAKRTNPKAKKKSPEDKLYDVAMDLMKAQVDEAIIALENGSDIASEALLDEFADEALQILTELVIVAGATQTEEGIAMLAKLGLATNLITEFYMTDDQIDRYLGYLKMVGMSYSQDTTDAIQKVLLRAEVEGLTFADIKKTLQQLPELEGYRATRIARTETVKAGGNGSLYAMEQIQNRTGYSLNKVWQVNSSDACEFCRAMDGTVKPVNQPYVPVGGSIQAGDKFLVNNFVDMDTAQSHPNCACSSYYELA